MRPRARALVSLIELANARRVDATRQSIERIARFFPAPSPRGAVVASFAFAFAFARAASASPISSSARVASFARARSFDRRTRPPIASTSADAPERRSRRASERKPGVPSGDAVATLIIPVTFPHSTRHERHERTHARRRTPTPRIASSPATRAFVSACVRRRGRVAVVSARRGAASTNRRFVGVSARQRASERGVRRALTRTLVDDARADRGAPTRVDAAREAPRTSRASVVGDANLDMAWARAREDDGPGSATRWCESAEANARRRTTGRRGEGARRGKEAAGREREGERRRGKRRRGNDAAKRAMRRYHAERPHRALNVCDNGERERMEPHEMEEKRDFEEKRARFAAKFAAGELSPEPAYRYEEPARARGIWDGKGATFEDAIVSGDHDHHSSSGANSSEETAVHLRHETTSGRTPPPVTSKPSRTGPESIKLCELRTHKSMRKNDTSTLPTVYSCMNLGVTPEQLLQGEDKAWWSEFGKQGAMVIKISDGWDILDDTSALCDLSWVGTKSIKLRTLGPDYQYIRQNLPDRKTGLLEPFRAMNDVDSNMEIGAFVEDFQERCRTHADQFRLMDVNARECWFLQQIHSGFPLQFPYLQGIAMEALMKNVRAVDASETPQTHPWDPRLLGQRKPSVLRRCLELCETQNVVNKRLSLDAALDCATPQSAEEARAEEKGRTGGVVTKVDQSAVQRRIERREDKKKGKKHSSAGTVIEAAVLEAAEMATEKASETRLWGVGIVSPWLYYMGVGSIFPLHFEDYAFASANVILARPDSHSAVVWYSIPRSDLYLLHTYLQETLGAEYTVDILEMRRLWLDPARIQDWNSKRVNGEEKIHVYRHVQRAGEYVVTDYGSVHWGVNLGDGWKAAVNFAYMDWKPAAEEVNEVYKRLEKETGMFRHHRCCPKFDEYVDFWADERIRPPQGDVTRSRHDS